MADNSGDGEDFSLNPEDIIKVIDLDEVLANGHFDLNGGAAGDGDAEDDGEYLNGAEGGADEEDGMEMEEGTAAISPSQDDSVLTFSGHQNEAVICCQTHPVSAEIVVTGGQDDKALVWNTRTGAVLFHCTGHSDTVNAVGFSSDGHLVATADMKGLVQVWNVQSGSMVWSFEVGDIEWIQWHQLAPVLLAGTKDGEVWMWKIPSGDCKTFASHGTGSTCGRMLPDGKHCCVGYEDGIVKIWDLKGAEAAVTITGHDGHKASVLCMDVNSQHVLTGSEDMTAKVISLAHGKVITTLACGTDGQEEDTDSVEAVGLSHVNDFAATGTLSGRLAVWDLPTKSVRHVYEHPYGIVKLHWSPSSPVFYTACLDGCVRQFDSRSGQSVRTWQGHTAALMDLDLARDESFLLSTSDDFTAKLYSLA